MSSLPVETITFLFTDIEGSTKLNQQYDAVMTSVLERHDALIENCAVQHEGKVVRLRGEGDSRFIVFARPTNAVAAACAMQQAILSESWQNGISLRVRVALHTGEADVINGDYRGTAVDRCARLRSIGHGGQTLLSQTTYDLVRDRLPQGASLQDMGSHRLKDLQRPERVFQLLHPELPSEFPSLKSLDSFPNNLPIQLTNFIGREQEIAAIEERLSTTRLLTLTGSGGIGKTRLALQVAADLLEDHTDGVWFVELAEQNETTLVPQVAKALGLREEPGRSLAETLTDFLKSKSLLLVLDNCEHLVASCAQLVNDLLRACPNLRVLATSRESLGIGGEALWRVSSLTHPKLPPCPPLESLTQYEAVRLFIERATAVKQDFTVTNQNAPALAEICYRLDGIALAIALAAVRVKLLSVVQICQRLESRFRLLTGGGRTALPRQQTLQAAVDWSHELLSESERILFRRLSVFVGGWTLEAAEAICAGEGVEDYEVLDLLQRLVDTSLVEVLTEERYKFLESIWQYSRDKLSESGEIAALQRGHLDWFLKLAEEAEPELTGKNQIIWLERLEAEHDNLRTALGYSQTAEGGLEAGLRLACALWRFWFTRGYYEEGREYLTTLLSYKEIFYATTVERANAQKGAGTLTFCQGNYGAAKALYEESLAIYRELGNKTGIANSLNNLGNVAYTQGNYGVAKTLYKESLATQRDMSDKTGIANSLNNLGNMASDQGDYGIAKTLYEESLAIYWELGNKTGIANSFSCLGNVVYAQGDYAAAKSLYEESLAITRELGEKLGMAKSLNNLGYMADTQGDYAAAAARYQESLILYRELEHKSGIADSLSGLGIIAYYQGDYATATARHQESLTLRRELGGKWGIAICLNNLGKVASAQSDYQAARKLHEESLTIFTELESKRGIAYALKWLAEVYRGENQLEQAARLFGAAEGLRATISYPLSPFNKRLHDSSVAALRAVLGEAAFTAAWEAGRAMTIEQAIAHALDS